MYKKSDWGPFLEWHVDDNVKYVLSVLKQKGKFINYIKENSGNTIHKSKLVYLPWFLTYENDSQNIYNQKMTGKNALNITNMKKGETNATIDDCAVSSPNHIEVMIIGGEVNQVTHAQTGDEITLVPNGVLNPDQAVIVTTTGGVFNFLYLPVDSTYRIDATKYEDFDNLSVYVSIPQVDGNVERFNYDDLATSANDPTHIWYYVGRDNTDFGIRRDSGTLSTKSMLATTFADNEIYFPDYNETILSNVQPPSGFQAYHENGQVILDWINTDHPKLKKVKILKKTNGQPENPDDGVLIYEGLEQNCTDNDIVQGVTYGYAAYSIDETGNYSEPSLSSVVTNLYSVHGKVTDASTNSSLSGVEVLVRDETGQIHDFATSNDHGQYVLTNLPNNHYTLEASHPAQSILDPVREIVLKGQNLVENFQASPKPTLSFAYDFHNIFIGNSISIPWSYQNIHHDENVDIKIDRFGSWEIIASEVPILDGKFEWNVSGPVTEDALFKLELSGTSQVYDEDQFRIVEQTIAEFEAHPAKGHSPLEVQFTDKSTGELTEWTWDFGDGSNSSDQNPVHVFQEGNYTIELIIDGPNGSDQEIKTEYIQVDRPQDTDSDALPDFIENSFCTYLNNADTDDDGILDGVEDANQNGAVDAGETDPCNPDTDGDGIQDGTELSYTLADIGDDTDTSVFQPDLDPLTTTDPLDADTDGDGIPDGEEDKNQNGRVDSGETDPNSISDDNPNKAMPWLMLLLED